MHLQLLRNATLKLNYAGRTVLIDPDFGPKHSRPSFTGRSPNPMVELPESIGTILRSVDWSSSRICIRTISIRSRGKACRRRFR
ncbi:hypothetical protein ACSBOB_27420 [Mesorhizobium sp. ASY16-5R]|uniref:hypothetical protein n=1 Tax=Mesorhizobium sp. ASY16-5R TaxID=3445772 RepID=UPI003FA0353E